MSRDYDAARREGIIPIDRKIDPASHATVHALGKVLKASFRGRGERNQHVPGISIISYNLFEDFHLDPDGDLRASDSKDIIAKVPSSADALQGVQLGELDIFGLDSTPKLGLRINSSALFAEQQAFIDAYGEDGTVLREDPVLGEYDPHLSLGTFDPEFMDYFLYEGRLQELDARITEVAARVGRTIDLLPAGIEFR